ncbi:DUF724 domain-containing protein 7 isoform X4 [Helianthus annuus]|uniref:DUF724 domain-containing protein 7 isoform X4 n=1 Tax=Helianthus annuus TaxID=4232 RepID=UPI000B8FAD39|nr:DUF724 domain-containing protein 7 isoform X4 [Helianthus annuus]
MADTTTTTTSLSFLTKGSHVEINSDEDSINGTWYSATVLNPPPTTRNQLVYVEYHNLSETNSTTRLREYANISYVRPSPVPDTNNPPNFQLNDVVDAFYRDGWWTGVITTVIDAGNFVVTFQNPPDQAQFRCSELRIHRKWVGGRWFQPQKQGTEGVMFTVGKKVEVSFERESLRDCWVPATILKNSDNNTFLVEYQQRGTGDEAILHKVTVDYLHIRPSPPHLRAKNFALSEKVDAYYDFGWWSGVITKELPDNRYNVFFKHTKKEREFIYSRVRPHMEWKGGQWFNTSQGDTDVKATPSLIDEQIKQKTPSIDKESTLATSTMKRTKQKVLDINGKGSPSSKKLKDEIADDDPSKKTNGPSMGQSEGFDSEETGMTDQANGKKGRRKLTTDSSRKRGRLSNELTSLQTSDKGSEVDSIKTRTKDTVEKEDITEDSPTPVVIGLQCNGMTVSQGKILQKLSIEKTPNVNGSDTQQQPTVPFSPLTMSEKGSEGDTASVAPKRKRGRPPKLRALSPNTSVTSDNPNSSAVPSAPSGQKKEVGLTTSLASKSLKENHGPVKEQPVIQNAQLSEEDKLPNENTGKDLDVQPVLETKKHSAKKGKRGKRKTISVNTESSAQDSRDSSKEKTDGRLEKDSAMRNPDASVGKSLDSVSDDHRPLSRWVKEKDAPITIHAPDGTVEQSSNVSEKLAICVVGSEDLPFVRNPSLWQTIESMDAFRMLPQKPHFRPLLEGVKESAREGLAIGSMVTFTTVVGQTCGMRFDDPRSTIEDCLETLVELEDNGFDVRVLRGRLTRLLLIKDKQDELMERSEGVAEKLEEHTVQRKIQCDDELNSIDRQIRELQERRKQVVLKKERWNSEISVMEAMAEEIEHEMRRVGAEFDALAATPL